MAEKPQNEFLQTMGKCLLGVVIAIALGCFIGYGLLIMIGHDTELTGTQNLLDRSVASREGFIAQNMEYQQAADILRHYPGLKVLRTSSGHPFYWMDGRQVEPSELMDESFETAIETLLLESPAALQVEAATTEELISDMCVYNIAVDELGRVCYYLYYDTNGYVCIAYDEQNTCKDDPMAVAIMDQWYILANFGDLKV